MRQHSALNNAKAKRYLTKSQTFGGFILMTLLLAGCGQKGPLTLPSAMPKPLSTSPAEPLPQTPQPVTPSASRNPQS